MQDGTYEGVTKSAVLYEAKSGAMMAVVDVDIQGQTVKAWITLVQKDGTVSERGIRNIQEVMEIQGWDWDAFQNPHSFAGHRCDAVLATEPDQNGELTQKIKWLNVPGGGSIAPADPKMMAAKYAAKFRAIAGGTPAARPATKPVAGPVAPPPRQDQTTSNADVCWAKLNEKLHGKPANFIESAWFSLIDKCGGGKTTEAMMPDEWGKALALINSIKPAAAPITPPPGTQMPPVEDNLPF